VLTERLVMKATDAINLDRSKALRFFRPFS
jgi:hypothetical protein